jgi:hypothetical protein
MKPEHAIAIIAVTIIFLLFIIGVEYYRHTSYVIQETPTVDDQKENLPCQSYDEYIKQPINSNYYSFPRFKNPRESCVDECVEGVWNQDQSSGTLTCCKKACETIDGTVYP